jgi:hypothetical protein
MWFGKLPMTALLCRGWIWYALLSPAAAGLRSCLFSVDPKGNYPENYFVQAMNFSLELAIYFALITARSFFGLYHPGQSI